MGNKDDPIRKISGSKASQRAKLKKLIQESNKKKIDEELVNDWEELNDETPALD